MPNLLLHQTDFGVPSESHFFATSHGKSACDGIGGTTKRIVAKESLRRIADKRRPINTANSVFDVASEKITGIEYFFVSSEDVRTNSETYHLQERFSHTVVFSGTRSHHRFKPVSHTHVRGFLTSASSAYSEGMVLREEFYTSSSHNSFSDRE